MKNHFLFSNYWARNYFKAIGIAILLFVSNTICAQGELLAKGQSGGAFVYSTAKIDKVRTHGLGYTYISKRNFDIGISGASVPSNSFGRRTRTQLNLFTSGYFNSDGILN